MKMDPHIALQLLLTLAKISGTILAIFMAIIIFALRDENLAQHILQGKPLGYIPLFTLLTGCICLALQIIYTLFEVFHINLEESYNDSEMVHALVFFSISIALVLQNFVMLLWVKRDFLKSTRIVPGDEFKSLQQV